MNKVHIILGSTSSGKTSLALQLCKEFGGEIVSVDSRQIYKGMNVGTGKVPVTKNSNFKIQKNDDFWTINDVKIWGYDLINPDEYFSAYDFAKWALEKTENLLKEGKKVFLVGGTGFFIDFLTGRSKPAQVLPDFNLRNSLENLSLEELQKTLMSLNLEVFERVDKQNPARLIRAIEIEKGKHHSPTPLPYLKNVTFDFIGLTASREILYQRADNWLDEIWHASPENLITETKSLILAGYADARPLNGIIYKSAKAFINTELREQDAKQQAKFSLHAYIRRQQTYFKKNKEINWFDITDPSFVQNVINHVKFS